VPGWKNAHDNSAVGFISGPSPSAIYTANPRTSPGHISPDRQVSDLLIQGRSPIPEPGNSRDLQGAATPSRCPTLPDKFRAFGVGGWGRGFFSKTGVVFDFVATLISSAQGKPVTDEAIIKLARVRNRSRNGRDRYHATMLRFRFRDR